MTLRERYAALMTDLVAERAGAVEGSWWAARLDQKIIDLKAATEERFGGGKMEADRPIERNEALVCKMCRAALHKHCGKWKTPQEVCTCDCARGY